MVKGQLELHILWKSVGMKENMERLLIGRKAIGIPRFIALRFIALLRYCLFYKLNVCGNRALNKSVSAIFPAAFYFVSLSRFVNYRSFNFLLLLYVFW